MMARNADPAVAAKWRRRLKRQASSGRSVAAFCEQEGVSPAAFYAWRKRLAESVDAADDRPRFVAIETPCVGMDAAGVQIELPSGALVTLPDQASPKLVITAIRAAMNADLAADGESC